MAALLLSAAAAGPAAALDAQAMPTPPVGPPPVVSSPEGPPPKLSKPPRCKPATGRANACMKRKTKRNRSYSSASGVSWDYGWLQAPQTGFRGCDPWQRHSGTWVTACGWANSSQDAPGGAHFIGWATVTSNFVQTYYWSNGRAVPWYWVGWTS